MKLPAIAPALACAAAFAQTPDFVPKLDLRPTAISSNGQNLFRWYDGMGRHSTVGFQLRLEPGYRAVVLQRLQRIPNDPDSESLDEAYVENPGVWRIGRQVAPFGASVLIREYVTAARYETNLVFAELPVKIAAGDNGRGRARGVVARIGRSLGASVAVGNHFGAGASSLGPIRRPEESTGRSHGYGLVLGGDFKLSWGKLGVSAEYVALRSPDFELDPREDVSDLQMSYGRPTDLLRLSAGWARAWRSRKDVLRAEAEIAIDPKVSLVGFVRLPKGGRNDWSVGARVKL